MRIAFYAPLKPPGHPVPSGDRRMARLLMAALASAGHDVRLASSFRSLDLAGDPARQARLQALGERLAARLLRRWLEAPRRPELWFTYHLYYKAPDWLGPAVARALAIPYVVAEASVAPKRAGGTWDLGHRAVMAALRHCDAVIALNRNDLACLQPLVPDSGRIARLRPFLDVAPYAAAARDRDRHRAEVGRRLGLDPAVPWLLAVAMMRPGDKLASFRQLADCLGRLGQHPWRLIVVGDGPARAEVASAFAGLAERVVFTGALAGEVLPPFLAAADLMVWPAVREAYGMALLEAQAAGLPVVAARTDGVPGVVGHGVGGLLVPPGDPAALAEAAERLLIDPDWRRRLGAGAAAGTAGEHGLQAAARALNAVVTRARAAFA